MRKAEAHRTHGKGVSIPVKDVARPPSMVVFLEQKNFFSLFGELRCTAQTADAGTDDDDIIFHDRLIFCAASLLHPEGNLQLSKKSVSGEYTIAFAFDSKFFMCYKTK